MLQFDRNTSVISMMAIQIFNTVIVCMTNTAEILRKLVTFGFECRFNISISSKKWASLLRCNTKRHNISVKKLNPSSLNLYQCNSLLHKNNNKKKEDVLFHFAYYSKFKETFFFSSDSENLPFPQKKQILFTIQFVMIDILYVVLESKKCCNPKR